MIIKNIHDNEYLTMVKTTMFLCYVNDYTPFSLDENTYVYFYKGYKMLRYDGSLIALQCEEDNFIFDMSDGEEKYSISINKFIELLNMNGYLINKIIHFV